MQTCGVSCKGGVCQTWVRTTVTRVPFCLAKAAAEIPHIENLVGAGSLLAVCTIYLQAVGTSLGVKSVQACLCSCQVDILLALPALPSRQFLA